ncbi:MAG TPA: metallopeptidase TldD-related protein [Ktedonobacterales bacterium]
MSTSAPLDTSSLAAALRDLPEASAWQARREHTDEAQLYVIGDRDEAQRRVSTEGARVVLHNDHQAASGLARGLASITLSPDEIADPDRLAAHLRAGLEMAALTDNPPFELPRPPAAGYPSVSTSDPALASDLAAVVRDLRGQLTAAVARMEGVRVSSAEFFATRTERTLTTSAGVDVPDSLTELFVDLVLIAGGEGHEAEFHGEIKRRRLSDVGIDAAARAFATYARDTLSAVMPDTHQGPVLLTGRAAAEIFCPPFFQLSPLVTHTSAQAAYQKLSRLATGQHVTGEAPRGDALTLWSDPLRPWGMRSWACDDEGVPATRVAVIRDGIFIAPWADARYGAYLGVPVTGEFGNVTVGLGSTPLETLRAAQGGSIYEIVALSFMNPDVATGNFVAEIKLGYRHDPSGVTPIKGGSLAGNIFEALGDAQLSREPFADGNYYGPAGIRFGALTISGS